MRIYLIAMMTLTATVASGQTGLLIRTREGSISIPMPVEQKVITGAPYSAEIETDSVQTLADGNRIVKHTKGRVYRDIAGRVRREEDQPTGFHSITIVDPVARMTYSVDAESHILWRSKMPVMPPPDAEQVEQATRSQLTALRSMLGNSPTTPEAAARLQSMKGVVEWLDAQRVTMAKRGAGLPESVNAPVTDEDLPATTLEGLRAEGRRRTIAIPAGAIGNERPITIVSEEWTSPDLNILLRTRHSDPRMGESTYRLRSISRSPPAPTLFQVPLGYSLRDAEFKRDE